MIRFTSAKLDPVIKSINIETGNRYHECKATVELEVSDRDDNRIDLIVEYPIQGEKHLRMLMIDAKTRKDINHENKFPIRDVIKDAMNPTKGKK